MWRLTLDDAAGEVHADPEFEAPRKRRRVEQARCRACADKRLVALTHASAAQAGDGPTSTDAAPVAETAEVRVLCVLSALRVAFRSD
jgi:hypothetical protein